MSHNDPDFFPIERRCQCPVQNGGLPGRRPPIRVYGPTAAAIKKAGILSSTTPLFSYRCPTCKGYVYPTAGDCHMGK